MLVIDKWPIKTKYIILSQGLQEKFCKAEQDCLGAPATCWSFSQNSGCQLKIQNKYWKHQNKTPLAKTIGALQRFKGPFLVLRAPNRCTGWTPSHRPYIQHAWCFDCLISEYTCTKFVPGNFMIAGIIFMNIDWILPTLQKKSIELTFCISLMKCLLKICQKVSYNWVTLSIWFLSIFQMFDIYTVIPINSYTFLEVRCQATTNIL